MSAVGTTLLLKTHQKWFLFNLLPCIFKIFIKVSAFLYVKANSKEISGEMSFSSFFIKMLMSRFFLRFKTNYFKQMRGYASFSLKIPIAIAI